MSPRIIAMGTALLAMAPLLTTPVGAASAPAADTVPSAATVTAQWQKHQLRFDFTSWTSYYTCSGLQDKVKEILLYFGARPNVRVEALGCPRPDAVTPMAWVDVQFETLSDAGNSNAANTVAATWQPVELRPNRPFSMGRGECEIVEKLKPVLTANFALQDLEYRTSCVPHQIGLDDYAVRGKVLQMVKGH